MSQDNPQTVPQTDAACHKVFPLALAQEGECVTIAAYRAGKGLEHKLRAMGLPVGAQARVIQRKEGAGVVLAAGGTRIAVGTSVAQQIYVELVAPGGGGRRPGGWRCRGKRGGASLRAVAGGEA